MSEFVKGACFARDKVLGLIAELQEASGERFAGGAIGSAKDSLQQVYNDVVERFGEVGTDRFQYVNAYLGRSFVDGAQYGVESIVIFVGVLQKEAGFPEKFSPVYQSLQWLLNEIEEQAPFWRAEAKELMVGSLAQRLNDFYKDFDFYDYQDSASCFGSEQEVIESIEGQLEEADAVKGILETLEDIRENGELDEEQLDTLNALFLDLSIVKAQLGMTVSDVLASAEERSEKPLCSEKENDFLK